MSNIGKQPISIPENVDVDISKDSILVKGQLGQLNMSYDSMIDLSLIHI